MDGFRDRFGSRYDRNSGRSTTSNSSRGNLDRDRGSMDRDFDYGNGRNDYQSADDYGSNSRRSSQSSMGGGGMDGRQLDIIRDYFDEAKDDSKEILHVVGNNSKMLDRSLDILGELKDKAERSGDSKAAVDFSGPIASFEELSKKNKEEIVSAIAGNADLLNLLKEEIKKNSEAISAASSAEGGEKEAADKEELEKYFADLTDHVHKENVKCYRNVAGALEEQEKKTEEKLSGLGMVKIFSIIQLALIVVNVVLLALYIFRVI